ncbi:AprI/Inh family metalloprotease inhibitor [Ciceribacter sp. RN22]|uniref:AprI/Inh family metalloprotease inhibitor n=1 Tax=Ciceribacter sp. RN22 TaxID=2954932 RepID=UPI002092FEF0|nr:AprI/Inh family metalloprotease inhibitor [Ciceribacter sp. RN22]MCO6178693.1 AprI/Inh family metalloprotease inhibitor [Ciceribacter sp. RN22]
MTGSVLMSAFASRTATSLLVIIAMLFAAPGADAGPAPGQFAGRWVIQSGGTDGCTLELQSERSGGRLVARSKGCKGTLASVRAWKPVPRGLSLLDKDGITIVTFEPVRGILFGRLVDGTLVAMRRMHD